MAASAARCRVRILFQRHYNRLNEICLVVAQRAPYAEPRPAGVRFKGFSEFVEPARISTVSPPPASSESTTGVDDTRWFSEEVHAHDSQLKAYLHGRFPSVRCEVDDVVQESYLRVWRIRASQPIHSAKAFLFSIAPRGPGHRASRPCFAGRGGRGFESAARPAWRTASRTTGARAASRF
jgi:hypothetical protein